MNQTNRQTAFGQERLTVFDQFIKRLRFNSVSQHIAQNSVVVDLGCGFNGDLLTELNHQLVKGIGFDLVVNPKFNHDRITLTNHPVDQPLPIDNNLADVVCALAIVEHVKEPIQLIKEAYRILKPGGLLIITTPSQRAKPLLELLAFRLKLISQTEISDHQRYYNQASLATDLRQAGFATQNITITSFELGFNLLARAIK